LGFGYISSIQKQRAVTSSSDGLPVSNQRDQMDDTTRHALRIRQAIQAIKPIMLNAHEIAIASPASASSAASLGIDGNGTPTTMQSIAEVNTVPTSYSTHGPDWTGASTAQATISGEYDGSNGTDTLTFEVARAGTHGSANLLLKVYDSASRQIDAINIQKNEPIDQQYSLSNGLVLSLGAGDLVKKDTFSLEVYDSVGTAVAPDNPFNGARTDDPDLQSGLSVTSGSFQINGVNIDVQDNDTINTVLTRISQSDANVTATFDAATETVLLNQKTPGPTQDIILTNDSSGFLAAVKLEGATATPGEEPETEKPLAEVNRFSSVQSGTISVNGVSINIDVNTDSLTDILDRITASNAEVSASFDRTSQRVTLFSDNPDSQLILASSATNFFPALGISDGTYNSLNDLMQTSGVDVVNAPDLLVEYVKTFSSDGSDQNGEAQPVSAADAKMLGTLVSIVADSMNALFDDSALTSSSTSQTESVRNDVRSAISTWFNSEGSQFNTDFGIQFDLAQTHERILNFSHNDFETALTTPQGQASIRNALFGIEADGLFNQLYDALTANTANLENEVGSTGLFLDALA
jgi:hypothetical protein